MLVGKSMLKIADSRKRITVVMLTVLLVIGVCVSVFYKYFHGIDHVSEHYRIVRTIAALRDKYEILKGFEPQKHAVVDRRSGIRDGPKVTYFSIRYSINYAGDTRSKRATDASDPSRPFISISSALYRDDGPDLGSLAYYSVNEKNMLPRGRQGPIAYKYESNTYFYFSVRTDNAELRKELMKIGEDTAERLLNH